MTAYLALLKGFLTGAGLIIGIGAQNAFVLKQGLKKNHVFATALFCSVSDVLLIAIGIGGLGEILTHNATLFFIAKWGGAAFLFWYGFRAFRSVFHSESLQASQSHEPASHSLKKTLLILAALTFLNPHVYLDTIVILGSIGSQFEDHLRLYFAIGVVIASFGWFFGLCYGARLLSPVLKKPSSWKVIDGIVGCMMWAIALSLLLVKS
ncbi:MAG: amino acid transporter [Verrucomicrobia bacterium]|nr:amino acid transporter [Verrucomicrobiota bacterium]